MAGLSARVDPGDYEEYDDHRYHVRKGTSWRETSHLYELSDRGGLGLTSIRERADSLGGGLKIDTKVGGGSRIQVVLDLDQVNGFSDSLNILDLL